MHYPRRNSKIKRVRKFGFRARMKTKSGRKMINARRRISRALPRRPEPPSVRARERGTGRMTTYLLKTEPND